MKRSDIADLILERLQIEKSSLEHCFKTSKDSIGYFFIDDVLPEDIATKIFRAFPFNLIFSAMALTCEYWEISP